MTVNVPRNRGSTNASSLAFSSQEKFNLIQCKGAFSSWYCAPENPRRSKFQGTTRQRRPRTDRLDPGATVPQRALRSHVVPDNVTDSPETLEILSVAGVAETPARSCRNGSSSNSKGIREAEWLVVNVLYGTSAALGVAFRRVRCLRTIWHCYNSLQQALVSFQWIGGMIFYYSTLRGQRSMDGDGPNRMNNHKQRKISISGRIYVKGY